MAMVETMKGEKEKVRRMDRVGGWRRGTGERETGGGKEADGKGNEERPDRQGGDDREGM